MRVNAAYICRDGRRRRPKATRTGACRGGNTAPLFLNIAPAEHGRPKVCCAWADKTCGAALPSAEGGTPWAFGFGLAFLYYRREEEGETQATAADRGRVLYAVHGRGRGRRKDPTNERSLPLHLASRGRERRTVIAIFPRGRERQYRRAAEGSRGPLYVVCQPTVDTIFSVLILGYFRLQRRHTFQA